MAHSSRRIGRQHRQGELSRAQREEEKLAIKKRHQSGRPQKLRLSPDAFETKVQETMKKENCNRSEATRIVGSQFELDF